MTHQDHINNTLAQWRTLTKEGTKDYLLADAYHQKINYHLNNLHQQLHSLNQQIEANPTIDPWEIHERDNLQQFITATEIEIEQFLNKQ